MKSNKQILILFTLLGFLLYGNTLFHEFTLDDAIVITDNSFTKKGWSGIWDQLSNDQFVGFYGEKKELVSGGRYRPLSMVVFTIQYALVGESPFLGHLCNILMYILNGFLLYLVFSKLLSKYTASVWKIDFPLLVSLLWFFHPIHTEVVANIKGLDEMMAFAGELLVLNLILNYLQSKQFLHLISIALLFFFTLLSKENAITWLAIIPVSLYFFTSYRFKEVLPAYASILIAAVCWFAIRYQVVGGGISSVADSIMNDPFLESSVSEKYATIVLTLGKYLQLLVFPHPLTYDYYPKHIPIVNWQNSLVILSLIAYAGLIAISIKGFFKKSLLTYGILVYGITLSIASNLFFPIGAFMNERFVYVSALGFSLILAYGLYYGLPKLIPHKQKCMQFTQYSLLVIALLYAAKTISRNQVWESNFTLATHDAAISVNGAKSNIMAGGIILEEKVPLAKSIVERNALLDESMRYLNQALLVYPEYTDALLLMGNAQWEKHKSAKQVMPYYYRILSMNPFHQNTIQNALIILEQEQDIDFRIQSYETLLKYNANQAAVYLNLGRAYGQHRNDLSQAKDKLEIALQLEPNNYEVLRNLGIVYGLSTSYNKAIEVLQRAIQIRPDIAENYIDLGVSYYNIGDKVKAKAYLDKAQDLNPNMNRANYPI